MAPSGRPAKSLRRVSTVDALSAALREQILEGALPPGTPLREVDIAADFQVSRHTVHTALRALTHEGIVRHAANRGAYVPDLSAEDIRDLFRLRTVLEGYAVVQCASGQGDLAAVQATLESLREIAEASTWGAIRDADLDFHKALIAAVGSERLERTYASLMTELRLSFLHLRPEFEDRKLARTLVRQHESLFAAIEAKDAARASELLEEHLDQSLADILGDREKRQAAEV